MPGRDVLNPKSVVERGCHLVDIGVAGGDEVKAAGEEADTWIDGCGRLDDLVNARMRAPDNDDEAIGRLDGER